MRTFQETQRVFDKLEKAGQTKQFAFDRYHVLGWHSDQVCYIDFLKKFLFILISHLPLFLFVCLFWLVIDQNQPSVYFGTRSTGAAVIKARGVAGSIMPGTARGMQAYSCDDIIWARAAKMGYLTAHADW